MTKVRIETRVPVRGSIGDHVYGYLTSAMDEDAMVGYLVELKHALETERFVWITTDQGVAAFVAVEHIVAVEVIHVDDES